MAAPVPATASGAACEALPPHEAPLLEVSGLAISYARPDGGRLKAVSDASLSLEQGRILGLVGASGSGKSTLVRAIVGMLRADKGSVRVRGRDVTAARGRELRALYQDVQMVFQSPQASFDPRRTLGFSITEGLRNAGIPRDEARTRVTGLLARCGLDEAVMARYPREVSGGQCQRAAIVRAVARDPKLLICDEATSALDTLVQAQIVRLIRELRDERGMGVLFVCHDLALAGELCDEVAVMREGRIVEAGPTANVLSNPQHPCTRSLLESARAVAIP